MTGEQWFQLWMTLLSAVVGGLVTLAGVWLGLRHGRKQQRVDVELARELDRTAAVRKEMQYRRAVLEDWDDTVVNLLQWLEGARAGGIGPGKLQDRRDYIEEYTRLPSRMVLDRWQGRSPEPESLEYSVTWLIHQRAIAFRDEEYPHAQDLLEGMDQFRIWLEDDPAGRNAIRSALARLEREIVAELELELEEG